MDFMYVGGGNSSDPNGRSAAEDIITLTSK